MNDEPFTTCSHCHRDVLHSKLKEHEFRCDDQPDVTVKVDKASDTAIRELLKDLIDRRPYCRKFADDRLEVPPEETGDSDYGLAPHERDNDDGQ